MTGTQCILLFVKSPADVKVKSRLAATVGDETARALYAHFVLDMTGTLKAAPYPFRICYHPPGAGDAVSSWLGNGFISLPQQGKDLGKRMENAFHQVFSEGFSSAIIIGSDIPDLPDNILNEALGSLKTSDAVIGPAVDGGYYLIGFRKHTFLPEVFRGRTWSTNTVLPETMELFKRSAYRVHLLPEWRDVDTIEDLRALLLRNTQTDFRTSGTMTYLIRNRKKIFNE